MRATSALAVAATLAAVGSLSSQTAQAAGPSRIWVSGHGADAAGCGAPASPCRSLQFAHDNVAAGGEIDVLDPAGYGAITITKAVSIVNDGVGTAGVQATSGVAVNINAGPNDAVYLKGLNIDGVQQQGLYGVRFISGGALTVVDCVIRHFLNDGVLLAPTSPTSHVLIANTSTTENGSSGIDYFPSSAVAATMQAVFDHDMAVANRTGMFLAGNATQGVGVFTIIDATISNNQINGLWLSSNANLVWASIKNADISENGAYGLLVQTSATAHLSRSTIDRNGQNGILNQTSAGGGVFTSGDSQVEGNSAGDIGGPAPTLDTPH